MPLSPFLGLSTIADLFLIIIFSLFRIKSNKHAIRKKNNPFKRFLGSLIMMGVAVFVFTTAVFMIHASAMEKHSSIHFIENHISFFNGVINRSEKLSINLLKTN